jgi:hypothetical protein
MQYAACILNTLNVVFKCLDCQSSRQLQLCPHRRFSQPLIVHANGKSLRLRATDSFGDSNEPIAREINWAVLCRPKRRSRFSRCLRTVDTLMTSSRAISLLVRPSTISDMTSRSRFERAAPDNAGLDRIDPTVLSGICK